MHIKSSWNTAREKKTWLHSIKRIIKILIKNLEKHVHYKFQLERNNVHYLKYRLHFLSYFKSQFLFLCPVLRHFVLLNNLCSFQVFVRSTLHAQFWIASVKDLSPCFFKNLLYLFYRLINHFLLIYILWYCIFSCPVLIAILKPQHTITICFHNKNVFLVNQ